VLVGRLEQFIHKMMSQAENSSGTREEQMARKQEILEELQRVEQELKYRTQRAQENQQSLTSSALVDPLAAVGAPIHPISTSINTADAVPPSTPGINLNQEFMEQAERQKQHEAQLQQQKEYYQTKLQVTHFLYTTLSYFTLLFLLILAESASINLVSLAVVAFKAAVSTETAAVAAPEAAAALSGNKQCCLYLFGITT